MTKLPTLRSEKMFVISRKIKDPRDLVQILNDAKNIDFDAQLSDKLKTMSPDEILAMTREYITQMVFLDDAAKGLLRAANKRATERKKLSKALRFAVSANFVLLAALLIVLWAWLT